MSRWLVGMSGDKDKMIEHLLKCEKRMLEQFAEIKEIAGQWFEGYPFSYTEEEKRMSNIIALCDVYLDRRSDKQKMQDEISELKEKIEKMEGDSECGCC